ncbi:hypothetical protein [Litchfieldia salsa]|uniref:Uncharacterized protein n=1 Tax=Litchfieldia salsa TaxID=930152 RepID=A0A1H0WDG3_9BACI|nr:hypothetical protein [Litchfieldia salsa]SDP88505.1 hypothetical protein SAMN05216565_110115 [Litchfieldia salsa]
MKLGTKVVYNDKEFHIFHVYESGYCELKEATKHLNIILVHENEITVL